jgi:hypothetical protein
MAGRLSVESEETSLRERLAPIVLCLLIAGAAGYALYYYWTRPPQMGTSDEVFKTVDALYTAVRSHDEKRMGECQQKLKSLRDANHLPAAAADSLDAMIGKAKSGDWDHAARQLYDFMIAQRREGPIEKHSPQGK